MMSSLVALLLIVLATLSSRSISLDQPTASHRPAAMKDLEDRRLHDLAIRDLKETQDEVAKMKAHGIGMSTVSGQK